MKRGLVRVGIAVVMTASVLALWSAPAMAHVTVNPRTAEQGSFTKVAFRVPNERANASTVKVEVFLPPEAPIASVSVRPTAGWTAVTETTTLETPIEMHGAAVTEVTSKITWTASAGAEIKPGEFQEFEVSLGPLPEVDQIVFKALQTYSNDEVVRWIEEPQDGVELENPAPVLRLTKPGEGGAAPATAEPNESAAEEGPGQSPVPTVLAAIALIIGLAGLATGVFALRRTG